MPQVLIVEDDRDVREMLAMWLQSTARPRTPLTADPIAKIHRSVFHSHIRGKIPRLNLTATSRSTSTTMILTTVMAHLVADGSTTSEHRSPSLTSTLHSAHHSDGRT